VTGGLAGLFRRQDPPRPPRHAASRAPLALAAGPSGTAARERPVPAPAGQAPPPPSFTPRRTAAAITMPIPVAPARPYAPPVQDRSPLSPGTPQWPGMRPVIGDAMREEYPPPPPPEPPAPECSALPYTEPGWAGLQMRRWVERGEWEPADSAVPAGFERNAAAMAVAQVRVQASILGSLETGCEALGLPGLASALWRRASELTRARREAAATAGGAR
jgi:hypothetical protein